MAQQLGQGSAIQSVSQYQQQLSGFSATQMAALYSAVQQNPEWYQIPSLVQTVASDVPASTSSSTSGIAGAAETPGTAHLGTAVAAKKAPGRTKPGNLNDQFNLVGAGVASAVRPASDQQIRLGLGVVCQPNGQLNTDHVSDVIDGPRRFYEHPDRMSMPLSLWSPDIDTSCEQVGVIVDEPRITRPLERVGGPLPARRVDAHEPRVQARKTAPHG